MTKKEIKKKARLALLDGMTTRAEDYGQNSDDSELEDVVAIRTEMYDIIDSFMHKWDLGMVATRFGL